MIERVDLQSIHIFGGHIAFVGVFVEQGFQYLAGLFALWVKLFALIDGLGPFSVCERRLVKGSEADQGKHIHVSGYCKINSGPMTNVGSQVESWGM